MERLGYIRDLEGAAASLGGKVLSRTPVSHISNPLNPTACFVIEPPSCAMPATAQTEAEFALFSVPGTRLPLTKTGNFYYSRDTGLCYPILKDIPVMKTKSAILASCLQD
jgi:uncharacterized protein YbaR (Trm112 family)